MPDILFSGAAGLLEGRYGGAGPDGCENVAIIFPPNPKLGGTMNNKVVYTLYQSMIMSKFATLRMNFRGIGRSSGAVAAETRELQESALQDATSAMDWLQLRNKGFSEFWVIGFSFGAWVAMQAAMRRPEVTGMIAINPPIGLHDFGFLSPCPVPCAVMQAELDTMARAKDVEAFTINLNKNRKDVAEYYSVSNADHMFTSALPELGQTVMNYTKFRLSNSCASKKPVIGFKERKRRRATVSRLVSA